MLSKGWQRIPCNLQGLPMLVRDHDRWKYILGKSTWADFVVKTAKLATKNKSKNNSNVLASCCFLKIRLAKADSVESSPCSSWNWATVLVLSIPWPTPRAFLWAHCCAVGSTGEARNGRGACLACSWVDLLLREPLVTVLSAELVLEKTLPMLRGMLITSTNPTAIWDRDC